MRDALRRHPRSALCTTATKAFTTDDCCLPTTAHFWFSSADALSLGLGQPLAGATARERVRVSSRSATQVSCSLIELQSGLEGSTKSASDFRSCLQETALPYNWHSKRLMRLHNSSLDLNLILTLALD